MIEQVSSPVSLKSENIRAIIVSIGVLFIGLGFGSLSEPHLQRGNQLGFRNNAYKGLII